MEAIAAQAPQEGQVAKTPTQAVVKFYQPQTFFKILALSLQQ
jgi:hypothetical protein